MPNQPLQPTAAVSKDHVQTGVNSIVMNCGSRTSVRTRQSTQVIEIRLPKQVAFKKEAAEQGMRLNKLFQEIWEFYRQAAGTNKQGTRE